MPYTVALPDGRTVEFPDSVSREEAAAIIRRQLGGGGQPESGFIPALKAGATELGGGISALLGKVGLKDEAKAQAEYEAAQKRAKEIFKPTEAGWTEAPVTKFTELLGGSLPYMAAPLAAGLGAAALPLTGTAAAVAGLGAAGLTSAGQFTATNLSRQMEEGKKLSETDLGAAALAAVPQAALDTLSMRMIPGIGRMFGQAGVKVTAETAKDIAEQGLKKTLIDYTAKTGKTAGIEGLTESAQQVFERLQAGLNITDEKARAEYFESFLGGAVLGGTLAPAGRYVERGREQREARGLLEQQATKEREAQQAEEKAKKSQPDYILGLADQYEALNKQKSDLMAQIIKGTKEAPLSQEDKDRNVLIQQQLKELEPKLKEQRKEYLAAGGPDAVEKAREQVLQLTPPPGRVTEPPAAEPEPEAPEVARPRYEQEARGLNDLLTQQRTAMSEAESPEDAMKVAEQAQRTQVALDKAQEALGKLPQVPQFEAVQKEVQKLEKKFAQAKEAGEQDDVLKFGQQLIAARQKLQQIPTPDQGLFAPAAIAAEQQRRDALGEAMGAGREAAATMRTQGALEQQAAREEAAQVETQRAQEAEQFRQAPQLDMFAPAREQVTRTVEAPKMGAQAQKLQAQIDALEVRRSEAADRPERAAAIDKQLGALQSKLDTLAPEATETRRVAIPPQEAVPSTQPAPALTKQIGALTERVMASPRVDEETKTVVQQIQADVPAFMRAATARAAEGATEMRQRAATAMTQGPSKVVPAAPAEVMPPQQVATWLYQTLNTGRADPADTARIRNVLQTMETAKAAPQPELPGVEPAPAPAPAPAAPISTLATREAEDATKRREEQARLERAEAGPRTLVQFEQQTGETLADEKYTKLVEAAYNPRLGADERIQASEQADAYLQQKLQKMEAAEATRPALIQKKQADLAAAEQRLDGLNKQLAAVKLTTREQAKTKGDAAAQEQILEGKRAKIQAAIDVDTAKRDKHQRLLAAAQNYPKVTRVDPAELRAYREELNTEILRNRIPGERLGVAEGTQQRAIGPLTRAEVIPPKALRTESPESRAGITATDTRQRLTEARGEKQRDVAITRAEQAAAEEAAAPIRAERKARAAKAAEVAAQRAAERKQADDEAKARLKAVQSKAAKAKRRARAVAESEELEAFEPEILGGPNEDVFFREAGPEYESRESTALNAATTEAVEDGDIRTALADLSENGSTEFVRTLAKRLGDMTMRTKLEVRDQLAKDGKQIEGLYVASKNLVQLHRDALSEEVLTHELTHAATMRVLEADPKTLTPEQRAARQEIENLHAAIQKQPEFAREYGRTDVKEFVSELMSNQAFRDKLDTKPGLLKRIYNALMRLIGMPRMSASEKAVENAYKLFMPSQVIQAAPAPSARREAPGMATANRVADSLIAKEKGVIQNLKDNFLGMGFRAQFVDKLAPLEEALKKGGIDQKKALQAMYYLRMYDQRMHFTSQAISDGVPEIVEKARKDGGTERLIETKPGANISQIVDILKGKDVVKAAGSPDAANRLFTLYLAAIRAERVGIDALNFGGKVTQADLDAARAEIEANDTLREAFSEARDIYNQYNRNLIEFAVQTGALARSDAKALLASNDYVPYYRVKDGVAQLIVGKETPIRIGNLKDSPHLKELVGGDEAIFDFLTSSVQNTAMLLDMSMKNLATKNAMFELKDVGLATVSKVPKSGKTPDGAVTFKRDGEDYYAVVDTDKIGIDGDLLVKGLAGIPTMFPSFVRVLGIPARFLRRAVVASPVYMARQLFRDSLAASMTSGANLVPVLDSLKQIGKPKALGARGITGGQVFTGMPEDVTRMLKDMQAGKVSVTSGLAWLEAKSAQADALTREAQYQSYRDQGLSEMEATYMALESMNFSTRGLSPTLHMVSTLIPFFNAQIQGLDVLYKAFAGQMPMNERLAIREKLWTRGLLLAGMSMAYALAMQDDETYKNAKPEEKYGNWFVQVPGFEQMVRLPIPFELGYVFKALPEAIVNTLVNDKGGEEALKAGKHIVQQMIPGASSYFLPQAVKPALETILGTSLYTGRSIESSREQMVEPGFRYRDNTTALAKEVGELTGFSPVKLEYLIRGYTGGMGMALLQALSAPFGSSGPESATKRMSDMPVIGTLFQPKDASGIIDATYERMKQVNQVKETYEDLMNKGRTADAQKYIAARMDDMALASVAGSFREYMGQITEFERGVRASNLTPDQKREKLDQARQMKIKLAESVRAVADRKTPQASPA